MDVVEPDLVEQYLLQLQERICVALEAVDGTAQFVEDRWQRKEGGGGRTRVLIEGGVFEKAGVNFSRVSGAQLPASATAHRPELAGRSFQAMVVTGHPSAQSPRADFACQRAPVRGTSSGRGAGLVVWRRLRPDSLLRVRGGLRALAPGGPCSL